MNKVNLTETQLAKMTNDIIEMLYKENGSSVDISIICGVILSYYAINHHIKDVSEEELKKRFSDLIDFSCRLIENVFDKSIENFCSQIADKDNLS